VSKLQKGFGKDSSKHVKVHFFIWLRDQGPNLNRKLGSVTKVLAVWLSPWPWSHCRWHYMHVWFCNIFFIFRMFIVKNYIGLTPAIETLTGTLTTLWILTSEIKLFQDIKLIRICTAPSVVLMSLSSQTRSSVVFKCVWNYEWDCRTSTSEAKELKFMYRNKCSLHNTPACQIRY
jgi:hypothetical protein